MASTLNKILGIQDDSATESAPAVSTQAPAQIQAESQPTQTVQAPASTQEQASGQVHAQTSDGEVLASPKKTVEERMTEWVKSNPEPVRREVEAPELSNKYDYASILEQYKKDNAPDPKVEKRNRLNQVIAASGDALSALINATGTSIGANNMKLDPSDSLSEKFKKRYKEDQTSAQELRDKYLSLMLKAANLEESGNMKRLNLYNSAVAKADTDYNTAKRNWDTAYDRKAKGYEREDAAEEKAQAAADLKAYREKKLALDKAKADETRYYHKQSLDIKRENDGTGGKGAKTIWGKWRNKKNFTDNEVDALLESMRQAGAISEMDYTSSLMKELGTKVGTIMKGANTPQGKEIMKASGFTTTK